MFLLLERSRVISTDMHMLIARDGNTGVYRVLGLENIRR